MISSGGHARRVAHLAQRHGRRHRSDQAISRVRRRLEKAVPENVMERPDVIERQMQIGNRQERGKEGSERIDTYSRPLGLTDMTLSTPWVPFWPPALAPGPTLPARIAATFSGLWSNMRARKEYLTSQTGIDSFVKSAQAMYLLAREQAFYRAPQYPPWASLPPAALAPELQNVTALLPQNPTYIQESSGAFIPLSLHNGTEPNTRHVDPYTSIGKPIGVYLFNDKHPISLQLFKWDSVKSSWGATPVDGKKNKKQKVDWIEGFRWSCMETYLKHLHAFSTGDLKSLRLLTTGEFSQQVSQSVRSRFRSSLSASRFDRAKRPAWNVTSRPHDNITYRWVFHGPYTGPGSEVNATGCRIRSIRVRESFQSSMHPVVGSRYHVQALVSFDTMQSLQVYSNGELKEEKGPRRVREDYVLEKRLYQPMPWAILCRIWDGSGAITPRLEEEF